MGMNEQEKYNRIIDEERPTSPNIQNYFKNKFLCCDPKLFKEEMKNNIKIGFPAMITNVFQYSLYIETLSFCGRLKNAELEGVGLSLSLVSAFGWFFVSGFVSACDTMFSQSFGSENKKRTGLFLQRALLLLNLVPICLWSLYLNFEPILILLRQDPEISRVAGDFMICFIPGITFMLNYLLLARYMQNQNCLWPPVVAGIFGNVFNICAQFLFVIKLEYGFKASAICQAFSYGIMTLIEICYIIISKFYKTTWPGFQLEALYDWSNMFTLGLAGVGHTTFEVIIWESSVFMGGLFGNVEIATQAILLQLLALMFMMYYGAGIASNIRVGQCLGANKPEQAKAAYRAGVLTIGIFVMILATTVILLRYQIPYVFTNRPDVIKMVIEVFPYMFVLYFSDPFSGICSACLRGCGRQASGCLIIFIAFYILSLPTSIILGFVFQFSIKGIWIGITIGSIVSVTSCVLLLECQDWNKQAYLAQQRIMYNSQTSKGNETDICLLPHMEMEIEENSKITHHIRTPSHPIMCSIDVVKLEEPRSIMNTSIIIKRIFTVGCVLIFFLCGLSIHLFLPTSVYRTSNSSNLGL